MTNKDILGRGWSFPPVFNINAAKVLMLEGKEDIESSLDILLRTKLGERIMVPAYGCNLEELLFKPLNLTLKTFVKDLIETAILYHEPRIDPVSVSIDPAGNEEGLLLINITYIIRSTNVRHNVVFPFYKNEGTEVK